MQDIYTYINRFQYISFDIFDTILKRGVKSPTAVFDIVENFYNDENEVKIYHFKEKRVLAEKKARKRGLNEDVFLTDIYSYLNLDKEKKEQLMELECYVEMLNCYPNKAIIQLYKKCLDCNKFIIITSDMYLNKKVIQRILCRMGVSKYNKLYISSDIGLTKRSGHLYKYILDDLRISENEMLHIGNDKITDYIAPQKYGIAAYLIKEPEKAINYWGKYKKDIALEHMATCINSLDSRNKTTAYALGYELIGPFLYQFCMWLHNEDKIQEFDKIVFIAREGYLPYLIYKEIYQEDKEKIYYLKINRNTLRLPVLNKNCNIENFISYINEYKECTVLHLCEMLFLEIESIELKALLDKYNYTLQTVLIKNKVVKDQKSIEFYNECIAIVKEEINKQDLLLKKYMEQNHIQGKVAMVNNSMHGSAQSYLQELFTNIEFWGIHFILSREGKKRIKDKCSVWFDYQGDQFRKSLFCRNSLIFEHLLFEDNGTAKFYNEINGEIFGVCEKHNEERKNDFLMKELRQGAIDFSVHFYHMLPMEVVSKENLKAISKFLCYPQKKDALTIGSLYDKDYDGVGQLASEEHATTKDIFTLFKKKKASWKQGLLTIRNSQILLILYNFYLRIEIKKKFFV